MGYLFDDILKRIFNSFELLNSDITILRGIIEGQEKGEYLNHKSLFKLVKSGEKAPMNIDNRIKDINDFKAATGGDEMPPKLKYGHGAIRQRIRINKNGVYKYWEASYMDLGERRYITTKTQEECLKKLKEALSNVNKNNNNKSKSIIKLSEWLDKWYKEYKEPHKAQSTLDGLQTNINKYIKPIMGNKTLKSITPIDIQKCLNNIPFLRQRDICKTIFSDSLREAAGNGLINSNPCDNVKIKKKECVEAPFLTTKQQILLLKTTKNTGLYDLILLYLWTGCTRSELLNINIDDININDFTIHIKGTKRKTRNRILPIFKPIKPLIIAYKNGTKTFPNISTSYLNRIFRKTCDNIKLFDIVIHSLRHTFATNAFERGVDIKTVQYWMGHSNYQTTADIYTHFVNSSKHEQEIKKMK